MKTFSTIILPVASLPLLFLSGSTALDLPQSKTEERDLLFARFQARRCQRKTNFCQAKLGVEQAPTQQWSQFLENVTGDEPTDEPGPLEIIRTLIDLAGTVDINAIVASLPRSVSDVSISQVIATAKLLISSSQSIYTAIQNQDYGLALSEILNIVSRSSDMFGASDTILEEIDAIIENIVDLIRDIINSVVGTVDNAIDYVVRVIRGIIDFLIDLLNSIISIFTGDNNSLVASCNADLLTCEYNRFLMEVFPNLVSAVFVTVGLD